MARDAELFGEDAPRGEGAAYQPGLEVLHRKAQAAVAQVLEPGEQVRLVIPGLASGAIIATERRAFVFKTGGRAGLPFSARLKEFEYESVMRFDLRPAGDVDVVVIHAPLKISTCSSYWADPRDDPWKARNAIAVTRGSALAGRLVEELSRLATAHNERNSPARRARAESLVRRDEQTPDVVGRIAERERSAGIRKIAPVAPDEAELQPAGGGEPKCSRCGSELGSGWQFCPRCGAPARPGRRERLGSQRRRRQPGRSS